LHQFGAYVDSFSVGPGCFAEALLICATLRAAYCRSAEAFVEEQLLKAGHRNGDQRSRAARAAPKNGLLTNVLGFWGLFRHDMLNLPKLS
jgi:hypothetical protein